MSNEDLVAETNLLIKKLLEMREQDKAQAAKSLEEFEVSQQQFKEKMAEARKQQLTEGGLNEGEAENAEEDFEDRLRQMRTKSKENLEASKARELGFRRDLMDELEAQTALLKQILAKLEG